jgi:hypothetical protein
MASSFEGPETEQFSRPHPEASGLWNRVDGRRRGVQPDPMVVPNACKELAERSVEELRRRLAAEAKESAK